VDAGNDVIQTIGGDGGPATVYGDAGQDLSAHAHGGDDSLTGTGARFYGDAGGSITGSAFGGNDTALMRLTVGPPGHDFYGDAGADITDNGHGGNDSFEVNLNPFDHPATVFW
jgi:hypothetical protein